MDDSPRAGKVLCAVPDDRLKKFLYDSGAFVLHLLQINMTSVSACAAGTKDTAARRVPCCVYTLGDGNPRISEGVINMRKLMVILMAMLMVFSLACAGASAEGTPLAGGWQASADPAVTEALRAVFEKGMEGLLGVSYTPVVYLGSQVVAGTNHAFLCQATVVYPGAQPYYTIVYLYEDLQGNVTILNIAELDVGALCTYGAEE